MIVKAIKPFFDKLEGVTRNMGDTFNVTNERYKELNTTKFGILVEEIAEAKTNNTKKETKKNTTKKVGD